MNNDVNDVNGVIFESGTDIDRTVATLLFDYVYDLASKPEGASARLIIKHISEMKGVNYPILSCAHCGAIGSVLKNRYDGKYVCANAQTCYRSDMVEIIEGVMVSVRQYQRNTIVSYWDGRNLPTSIDEYMKMEKPTIYKRIENYRLDKESYKSMMDDLKIYLESLESDPV